MRRGVKSRAAACLAALFLGGLAGCVAPSAPPTPGASSGPEAGATGATEATEAKGATGATGGPGAGGVGATSPTHTGSSTASAASGAAVAAVSDLAARRLTALTTKDKNAWMATVADPEDAFGQQQAAVFDRMTQLPLGALVVGGVSVGPADPAPGSAAYAAPGASPTPTTSTTSNTSAPTSAVSTAGAGLVARLTTGYRLVGYDRGARTFDVAYTVVEGPSGWHFTGLAPGDSAAQPWDLPGMAVASSPTALVVGDVSADVLQAYLAMAEAGLQRVGGVLGASLPAVLVAPRTTDELVRQLGRSSASGLDQVAAVTDGPLGTGAPATADRVYLNSATFATLTPTGRQVVITHELTHVTIRGTTTRPVPIWLSEGFADYVGFSGSGLAVATVAADLLTEVRRDQGPTALPTAAAFDPTNGQISPVYNQAWLAIVRMVQQHGQPAAVAFYRAVAGGPVPDPAVGGSADDLTRSAFQSVLGTTQERFVADWLSYLKRVAG